MVSVSPREIDRWLRVVRAEFDEMPGLALSAAQAARLWSLEPEVCHEVLGQLCRCGYLTTTRNGAFRRASAA